MAKLEWDKTGERTYETGVSKGVLYVQEASGSYGAGVAWPGLSKVDESPSGAEPTKLYANNGVYVTLMSAEEYAFTIEAYDSPEEFDECDGTKEVAKGITIRQQDRTPFGFSYRTEIGNDTEGTNHGYKLHLVYGCKASPSSKSHETINDSPSADTLSWEVNTTPVAVEGFKPTAVVEIDSTTVTKENMQKIEDKLYGTASEEATLPSIAEIIELVGTASSEPGIGG